MRRLGWYDAEGEFHYYYFEGTERPNVEDRLNIIEHRLEVLTKQVSELTIAVGRLEGRTGNVIRVSDTKSDMLADWQSATEDNIKRLDDRLNALESEVRNDKIEAIPIEWLEREFSRRGIVTSHFRVMVGNEQLPDEVYVDARIVVRDIIDVWREEQNNGTD